MGHVPDFNLISFSICPFVQRSRILLNSKGIGHRIDYIDLANKPGWFLDRVPTGRVPALFIGTETLFESAVINEYLDEVTPGSALPEDPLERAKARAWIKLSDDLIMDQFRMFIAQDEAEFEEQRMSLEAGLARFAPVAEERAGAADLTLLDAAVAPVFTRLAAMAVLGRATPPDLGKWPEMAEWSARLLKDDAVKTSVAEAFDSDLVAYFSARDSFAFAEAA